MCSSTPEARRPKPDGRPRLPTPPHLHRLARRLKRRVGSLKGHLARGPSSQSRRDWFLDRLYGRARPAVSLVRSSFAPRLIAFADWASWAEAAESGLSGWRDEAQGTVHDGDLACLEVYGESFCARSRCSSRSPRHAYSRNWSTWASSRRELTRLPFLIAAALLSMSESTPFRLEPAVSPFRPFARFLAARVARFDLSTLPGGPTSSGSCCSTLRRSEARMPRSRCWTRSKSGSSARPPVYQNRRLVTRRRRDDHLVSGAVCTRSWLADGAVDDAAAMEWDFEFFFPHLEDSARSVSEGFVRPEDNARPLIRSCTRR